MKFTHRSTEQKETFIEMYPKSDYGSDYWIPMLLDPIGGIGGCIREISLLMRNVLAVNMQQIRVLCDCNFKHDI